jgi:HK97 family phage prohead protease
MESWARGAFRSATKDPTRVGLTFMHLPGLREVVGRGVQFTESDEGLDGVFRAVEHDDGDKALALVRDGSYRGLSIHAAVMRSRHRDDDVLERQVARLIHVALVDVPAYEEARVTAVRAASAPAPAVELTEIRARQERYRLRFGSSAHS